LRKTDPEAVMAIIDLFARQKNSWLVARKMENHAKGSAEEVITTSIQKKMGFLDLEL
jgi:hypothetical protein